MVARLGRGARAGSFGVVRVRDFGTGMTDAVKARLFDPFFTTKAPGKGTGLGLAAVLRILSSHQGFVSVDSTLGVGTCFTCHFPLAE
jgi:signal transduction histidine kinase